MREKLREYLEALRVKHGAQSIYALLAYRNIAEAHDVALNLLRIEKNNIFYFAFYKERRIGADCLCTAYDSALRWLRMTEDERINYIKTTDVYRDRIKQPEDLDDILSYTMTAAESVIFKAAAEVQEILSHKTETK